MGVGGAGDELRGGAEGELTTGILRIKKRVIRSMVGAFLSPSIIAICPRTFSNRV